MIEHEKGGLDGRRQPDAGLNNRSGKKIMEMDRPPPPPCFLLFRLTGAQSVSSEGRDGKRAVDYAVGRAIHQCCRRVVRLMI